MEEGGGRRAGRRGARLWWSLTPRCTPCGASPTLGQVAGLCTLTSQHQEEQDHWGQGAGRGGSLQPAGPSWRRCQWSTSVLPDSPKANILPNCLSTFLSITTHSFTHTTLTLFILDEQLERRFFPQAICRHHETSPFNTSACISQGQAHPPT